MTIEACVARINSPTSAKARLLNLVEVDVVGRAEMLHIRRNRPCHNNRPNVLGIEREAVLRAEQCPVLYRLMRFRQRSRGFYLDDRVNSGLMREYQVRDIPRGEWMLDGYAAHISEGEYVWVVGYPLLQFSVSLVLPAATVLSKLRDCRATRRTSFSKAARSGRSRNAAERIVDERIDCGFRLLIPNGASDIIENTMHLPVSEVPE